jgi:hypothetical protein
VGGMTEEKKKCFLLQPTPKKLVKVLLPVIIFWLIMDWLLKRGEKKKNDNS